MEKKQGNKIKITTEDGTPFRIPVEGSLGLLALGYKGVIAWRQARWQYQKMKEAGKEKKSGTENPDKA